MPDASIRVAHKLRVCLAASGGGHLRQLLDLEPAWSKYDYFFISENSALSRSVALKHPAHFVTHVALGQARLGAPLRMVLAGARNLIESARIILRERPDVVISTGAGAVFPTILWSKLIGAKVVMVESFARFDGPSIFGKLTAPLATFKVAQSRALQSYWPDAAVLDPLLILDTPRPSKKSLMFVTVGTVLPFDRLIDMVTELRARGEIPEELVIQAGAGGRAPADIKSYETMPFEDMLAILRDADIVVCHAGTGSLITALREGCRVIAVPRESGRGEVYDDHQEEICQAFAARGMITVARTVAELSDALKEARARTPVVATANPGPLIKHIDGILSQIHHRAERGTKPDRALGRGTPRDGSSRGERVQAGSPSEPPAGGIAASPPRGSRLRVCLAASGGGHVRQLLDIQPVWNTYDHFFLTENTALSRSIAKEHAVHFVTHVAWGQARHGHPLGMVFAGARNFIESFRIILRERPDVIISTGAGAVYASLIWGKLLGAKIVLLESFARFDSPSLSGKFTAPLAHHKVVQSPALQTAWPDARVFEPLKILDTPRPEKKPLAFVTVGTVLPFDRLVDMVVELKARGELPEEVVIQTGAGGRAPEGLETHESLPFDQMQAILRQADIVICHAGTGSLITALQQGCRVIAVPRRSALQEHYDDHQEQIARVLAERGLVAVANTTEELSAALKRLREREPITATSDPSALIAHLGHILSQWSDPRGPLRARR